MESAPAVFAGSALVVFGAALLLWISVRTRSGRPVVEGAANAGKPHQGAAAALTGILGVISLITGVWMVLSG